MFLFVFVIARKLFLFLFCNTSFTRFRLGIDFFFTPPPPPPPPRILVFTTKIQMGEKLTFISLNVRGLSNFRNGDVQFSLSVAKEKPMLYFYKKQIPKRKLRYNGEMNEVQIYCCLMEVPFLVGSRS